MSEQKPNLFVSFHVSTMLAIVREFVQVKREIQSLMSV
jgi:hypothetical protein